MSLFFSYIRLSCISENEEENKITLDTQIKTIEDYYQKNFEKTSLNHFIDNGISGSASIEERPALKDLFNTIIEIRNKDNFNEINVIIYDPDRLSRDILIFQNILNFFSNKCVKVFYTSINNDNNTSDMLVMFKTIIAEQERKNTIRRINNFFKLNKGKWDTKRVGFGYEKYDKISGVKIKNEKEYEILMLIKQKYEEECESLVNIASFLNDKKLFNRTDKEWTTSSLDYIISKNEFEWGIYKKYFELENKNFYIDEEKKIVYIKDIDLFLSVKENDFSETYTYMSKGKKVNMKFVSKKKIKEDINEQIKNKIEFWLINEKNKYYSNSELYKKIRTEFSHESRIKNVSNRVLWDLVKDVRNKKL